MPSGQFITNKDNVLSEIIGSILPLCDNAYFLVGYFYFSGFRELYEKLKDVNLRILVGLEAEKTIVNSIREIDNLAVQNRSRGQARDDYYNSLVDIFNNTDFFDCEQQIEAFRLFCDKIENGSLQIRKTADPNHAKMYLFENRDENNQCGTFPGTLITGSSNLSIAGLRDRLELNAILRNKIDYEEGRRIFDELWDNSIVLADSSNIPEFNEKVIKHIWYEKLYSPYLMYIRVLNEYFSAPSNKNILRPSDITDGVFSDLKYQLDAVQMALKAIENHSGVIIADVVGLGKSIIASTVARNLRLRTIIVCPPHLKTQWEEYKDQFGFTASVFSGGKIEAALEHFRMIKKPNEVFLIIVDEAHKYKNEYIQDYSLLHDLCMGNKVMLLTATPFNNRPADIFSMLKLFQIPSKSTLKTVDNLGNAFKELIDKYKKLTEAQRQRRISDDDVKEEAKKIAQRIRSIIMPLVVRRSRLDLEKIPAYSKDLEAQGIKTVVPDDPVPLEYNLGKDKELYLKTLNLISPPQEIIDANDDNPTFTYYLGARYKPSAYLVNDKDLRDKLAVELEDKTGVEFNMLLGRQSNISNFMRTMLVRRFESSVAAFKASLNSMILSSENILKWIDKRDKVPVYKKGMLPDVEDFYLTTDDDLEDEIQEIFEKYESRGFFEIDMKYIRRNEYMAAIHSDLELLKQIRTEWFGKENAILFDHKIDAFKKLLKKQRKHDPRRKIIVFTEFADTANYLGEVLANENLGVLKYTSADASQGNKSTIRLNFDAGIKSEFQKDDYQILIATDAISEGYNLHRAGAVFNYDIPYNPTRVIQRIGRINRINKKMFDHLYIYNYFPTDIGEAETRTKQISTLKMAMIHAIMGEDTKVLTSDEKLNAYFVDQYKKELANSEELSWDTKYRQLLASVKHSPDYSEAMHIPHRCKVGRKIEKPLKGVLLFGKKGDDYIFKLGNDAETQAISISAEDAFVLFEAEKSEDPQKLSKQFDKIYQHVKASLFKDGNDSENERNRLEAYSKIKVWLQTKVLPADYLKDLMEIIKNDGLTGEELRFINKQNSKSANKVQERITEDYIQRIINKMNSVEEGAETLILAEEIL